MLRRILHSAVMLAAIVVAYQAYFLLAVPWLEPPLALRPTRRATTDELNLAGEAITKYQTLLAAYFPTGHWSLVRRPIVIESGPAMLVLDDYQRHDDGRVELTHFALLIFPTPRTESATPPRDAVILEAPQGAKLQFDKNFRPERGQIGQITRGEFPGRITIRSDMQDPGAADDLLIETTDLEMNSKLLVSPNEVHFRLGPNVGRGRELEIRFLEEEQTDSRSGGLKIAGIDSLEIRREVRLRAYLGSENLLPGRAKRENDRLAVRAPNRLRRLPDAGDTSASGGEGAVQLAAAEAPAEPAKPPVELTCTGPFRFDLLSYVASFDRDVEVWQINPNGPSDQLSCQQLDIHFMPKAEASAAPRPALDASRRQRKELGRLEPERIVAQGHPVVIVSPANAAEARGGRIQLMLRQRKIIVDGGQDVTLTYGPNVVRAPAIEYQHPADDAATKIGNFRAEGPGTLRYVPEPDKPHQVLQAAWQATVELGRHNGQPVLTVAGRPRLVMSDMGQLVADQIRVFLRELEVDGKTRPVPDRMNAVGQVEIDSPELHARTRELVATFRVDPEAPEDDAAAVRDASRINLNQSGGPPSRAFQLTTDQMQLGVALRGRRAAPTSLACNGNVVFRQLPAFSHAGGPQQSFEVGGGQLTAEQLDSAAHIIVRGAAPGEPAVTRPAEITARGMTVRAPEVHLDEGQNRLWIDGPGTATLLTTRDLSGRETLAPTPIEISWQGGLNFDGLTIVCSRDVLVEGPDDTLRCDELAGMLIARVDFRQRIDQNAVDLAEAECRGHVVMDHKSRDETGLTSHERFGLARLNINQQTGAIRGDGPGVIRSTHFASQLSALGDPATARSNVPPHNSQLQFLRVDFQSGLTGNISQRSIEFHTRVRTVYGPVDTWEQELDLDRPETMLPGTLTLTSDRLRVNEDPIGAARDPMRGTQLGGRSLGPIQMQASGNVRIEGSSPTQGSFTAFAERAAYEKAKELFILEGTDRSPATLWHQRQPGGHQVKDVARKFQYSHVTGQFQQEGGHMMEFTPGGPPSTLPQNAIAPAPRRQ